MSDVKRYSLSGDRMFPSKSGHWVTADDHDALAARLAEAKTNEEAWEATAQHHYKEARTAEKRLAEAERDRAEIMRLWFQDANPGETRFASLYAVFNGAPDSASDRYKLKDGPLPLPWQSPADQPEDGGK